MRSLLSSYTCRQFPRQDFQHQPGAQTKPVGKYLLRLHGGDRSAFSLCFTVQQQLVGGQPAAEFVLRP